MGFGSIHIVPLIFVYGCLGLSFLGSNARLLPQEEVQTLQVISEKLQLNRFWKTLREASCTNGDFNNTMIDSTLRIVHNVTCNCNYNNDTVCHVDRVFLKSLNLTGSLPQEFGNLTHLEELDLARNYIHGRIPPSFSRLPLRILSLMSNRLSGSIPPEIAGISSLTELVLDQNQMDGDLPEALGDLNNLERLVLSSNNFTGILPELFGKLKNLTQFMIGGNGISGKIPDFIGNWTNIKELNMQGTSMEGPIPTNISLLTNLLQLRISDIQSPAIAFPNLRDLKSLETLVLRNCSINGEIEGYLKDITSLRTLDLSFNNLTGVIPWNLTLGLSNLFLTSNSLTGEVPRWMYAVTKPQDLSHNYFSGTPTVSSCYNMKTLNLVSSYPSSPDADWCFKKDLPCPSGQRFGSLFINCGGERVDDYQEDTTAGGPAYFSASDKWAFSLTGSYKESTDSTQQYLWPLPPTNKSSLGIFRTARIAPISLKYYGRCLRQGNYKVTLHFAEIMFTDDQTYSSLGRRIFDISIQGKLHAKDFNIAEKAGGVNKGYNETFDDIIVDGGTLEIHLYWAGKGTTAIPFDGVYGPLISAISVTAKDSSGLSAGAIIGIVVLSCVLVALVLFVLRMMGYIGRKDLEDEELRGLELQTGYFSLRQIKSATGNFDSANKIGEGGFGPVFKGVLPNGLVVAVKQLSAKSKQGNREFVNEIGMISALQHPNLVRLHGCCIEGKQLLLVYEYLENNSLARALFGPEEHQLHLDWPTRQHICMGIAKGLAYLHEESALKIVHRDIKATNVLLDKDLNAKISDFGLAKLDEEENTHISTRIAGTIGYMAPEYATRGYLTDKADVYSFGIVALEIASGKSNTNYRPKEELVYLLDWACVKQEQGELLELVDPRLGSNYSKKEAMAMLNLALLCANQSPSLRPSMSSVVTMLEGKAPIKAPAINRSSTDSMARFKAFEKLAFESQTDFSSYSNDGEQVIMSMDAPWNDSSVSNQSKDGRHESISSASAKLLE